MNTYSEIIREKGIDRLCHFTHCNNLGKILSEGILSSKYPNINRNDLDRADGYLDYVCTSIQYPNVYCLRDIIKRQNLKMEDFVILEVDPNIINDTTNFCYVNSAQDSGRYVSKGVESFKMIFSEYLEFGKIKKRNSKWVKNAPTNLQAEVLIFDKITVEKIKGIIFHENCIIENILKDIIVPSHIRLRKSKDLFEKCDYWLNRGCYPYDFSLDWS